MRKTIQIGDKYKPLMDYYSEQFDKEEFNIFITKLLIAYKRMKDKNIDLITFSELIEPYQVDIIDLIKLITEHVEPSDTASSMDDIIAIPSHINNTKEEKRKRPIESKNTKVTALKPQTNIIQPKINHEGHSNSKNQQNKPINNPILNLGIDLSQ